MTQGEWGLPPLLSLGTMYVKLPGSPKSKQLVTDQVKTLRPLPVTPIMVTAYYNVYGNYINDAFNGRRSASSAAAIIDAKINAMLAKRKKG